MTPAMVHHGQAAHILADRQVALDAAFQTNPEPFVRKPPRPPGLMVVPARKREAIFRPDYLAAYLEAYCFKRRLYCRCVASCVPHVCDRSLEEFKGFAPVRAVVVRYLAHLAPVLVDASIRDMVAVGGIGWPRRKCSHRAGG